MLLLRRPDGILPGVPFDSDFEGRSTVRPLLRFRCSGCGYGASSRGAPARCPMCGGREWDEEGWRPFADLAGDLALSVDADAPLVRDAHQRSVFPGVPLS